MMQRRRRTAPSPTADLACACATARQVARTLTQLYDSRLRHTGMEAPQFALLMTLHHAGPCSQAALGRSYALDKTTVSRNLKWLELQGWIASSHSTDRRHRQFTLTAEGRRQLTVAIPAWKTAQAELRSRMGTARWRALFRAFRTVSDAAQVVRTQHHLGMK